MSWNFRVVRERQIDGVFFFTIREAHYNDAGVVTAITASGAAPMHVNQEPGDGAPGAYLEGLRREFEMMQAALRLPVLDGDAGGPFPELP